MPITHGTRYEGKGFSSNGRFYHFKIYDRDYTGQVTALTIGGGGIKIKYDTSGQDKFSPIIASKCTVSFVVENNISGQDFENFILRLRNTYEEGDATLVIWNTGSTSEPPLWSGNIMIDLSAKEDVSKPYEIELSATDGIGLLKNYDMVQTQGAPPYSEADTYVPIGYKEFTYWIKEILEFCNTPDSDSTDGDVGDYTFSTSVDWWYTEHPTASAAISPLHYTRCKMDGAYTIENNGLYKVQSVYDVLEAICKMWGMRVAFWKNRFYFVQLELYNTADSGTFAVPDDVDSQIFTRFGVFSSGRDYLGESDFTAYSQDIETNAGGFAGGLQKLAGSKWDYYPKLKEVTVDFVTLSNNNYFTTFPQPTTQGGGTFPPTYFVDIITSTSLGTHSDAASFGGFNVLFLLDFSNTGAAIDYNCNATIRARPSGDTNWDNGFYFNRDQTTWEAYPTEAGTTANKVWFDSPDFQASAGLSNMGGYFLYPAIFTFSLPNGTSQHTIYSGYIPTDAAFTGDWEFEIFTLGIVGGVQNWTPAFYAGHHGADWTLYNYNLTYYGVSYSDPLDLNGSPLSQFNPVLNNAVGGGNTQTVVYSARTETQTQEIKNIWWGDTLTYGEPSSLKYYTAAYATGYTDPAGLWRRGSTGSFDKTLAQLLAESRLFFQQTADYKWSLTTAVSDLNWWKSDGTALRPVYINPIGKIHDTQENIFYYLLRGTYNVLLDEWQGEWVQISDADALSVTVSTTGTGGNSPTNNTSSAKLSAPSSSYMDGYLTIGSIAARIDAGTTITSISIRPMNPIIYADEGEDTVYLFDQNTLIKSGDVFNISLGGSGQNGFRFQQLSAAADVANDDETITVASMTLDKTIEVGDLIVVNLRDSYQQINHKTRGTIHIPQYSLSESSADPSDPSEGNAVIWMSDGTASGNDGDIIAKIHAGGVIKRFNIVDFGAFTNTYSIDFDGVDDYVDISGSASVINEDLGSASMWVKLDTTGASITVFQAAADTSNFIRLWYKDSDSTIRFQTKRGGTNNVTYYAGGIEADGNWHHLALTWDSSANELKGYLDGVARGGTGTAAGSWSGSLAHVDIGKLATADSSYWVGNIDEVGIWDSVLTAAEITEIYNSGTPLSLLKDSGDYSSSGDLIGWWRMGDSATYPTIPDDSTNSNNGTMTNMSADDIVQDIPE